jgi:hypothetical protein
MMPVRSPFLFEFMDLPGLPNSLRGTLQETLESCLAGPPRQYYDWVVGEILELVERDNIRTVIEMAAGTAPIARRLAMLHDERPLQIEVSDLYPNRQIFQDLELRFPGIVRAHYEPVHLSKPPTPRPSTLLVFSASFHHLAPAGRERALRSLFQHHVAVFEPLRCHPSSLLLALAGFAPGLTLPLRLWKRPGNLRRCFWSWLVPAAPFGIVWDGAVSVLRCWSEQDWRRRLASVASAQPKTFAMKHSTFCQMVTW